MGFKRPGKIASKGMRRHVSVFTLERRKGDLITWQDVTLAVVMYDAMSTNM